MKTDLEDSSMNIIIVQAYNNDILLHLTTTIIDLNKNENVRRFCD